MMERPNIRFLTLHAGCKTEFQGRIKGGQFTKCEKDVVFDLRARGERFRGQMCVCVCMPICIYAYICMHIGMCMFIYEHMNMYLYPC